jgi:hypothetical protein
VQLVRDVSLAEAEYRDADEAWLRNDPNLTKDLLKADPEDVRRRIHRAAALREDVMTKKATYLQLIIERLQETRKRLLQASEGAIPTAALEQDLQAQHARALDEQDRVESLLRDLPQGDEYLPVKHALNEERTSLIALEKNIVMRIRSLQSLGKAQEAMQEAAARDPLAEKVDGVLQIWEAERAGTVSERSRWAEYYRAMERSLDQKEPAGKGPSVQGGGANTQKKRKRKDKNTEQPVTSPPAPAKESAPSSSPVGMAGAWVYRSRPATWAGNDEPVIVVLNLRTKGGQRIGASTARLLMQSRLHDVGLTPAGAQQSGTFAQPRWNSQKPRAQGEMEIRLSADGRILVERAL